MKQALGSVLAAVVCVSGLAALQWPRLRSQLREPDVSPESLQAQEVLQRDRLRILKTLPTLGFDNLIADWAFLNFLQYFGNTEARQVTGYQVTPEFFSVIVRRDPFFRLAYRYLSSTVTLFAGQPAQTVSLLEQGLSHMSPQFPPDSFWLWRLKAVDELLFLGDTDAAIESFEQNAAWAAQSPVPEAADHAASAQRIADFLRQDPANRQVRANSWLMVWSNSINEEVRQYAEQQIEALGFRTIREGNSLRIEDPEATPQADPNSLQ
jgi:hypothetical protein